MRRLLKWLIPIICLLPSVLNAFCFEEAGKKYDISPLLLECIAKTESNFDPGATYKNTNGSVDLGLMQVNSYWVKAFGLDRDRLIADSCYNAMAGARILSQCVDHHGYTWEAVGCYNAVSMDKKKAYSWKIFRQLKAEGRRLEAKGEGRNAIGKKQEMKTTDTSSLSFRARDIFDISFGDTAQSAAGGTH